MNNIMLNKTKIQAEITKLQAETLKLQKESKYFLLDMLLKSSTLGAIIGLLGIFLGYYLKS